ncbi:expressed unknown protein [Seminavis robusta]|uniref:Uncharacterized protein n=1 Tax=Seminavis robusta TaxID=568900 RepID=A0A9N8HEV8_9STRA|nr:expressed unknown protein [Seminavis robusta]|eukprot:Sro321_g116761.1  (162) ;mRNA; r:48875-49360
MDAQLHKALSVSERFDPSVIIILLGPSREWNSNGKATNLLKIIQLMIHWHDPKLLGGILRSRVNSFNDGLASLNLVNNSNDLVPATNKNTAHETLVHIVAIFIDHPNTHTTLSSWIPTAPYLSTYTKVSFPHTFTAQVEPLCPPKMVWTLSIPSGHRTGFV